MRIACIHIPQYALQCATRLDPSLRGAPVAMVAAGDVGEARGPLHAPIVVACSRAAWALGVRLGMTATAARAVSGATPATVVGVEPAIERETVRAVAEALLELTPVVDLGGRLGVGSAHLAMYAEVPVKTRGASFGERVLERLEVLGLTGRVGIADDRFTAWVAAAHGGADQSEHQAITMVPRGGSAAFLAPRALSLLAIPAEVQHMLEALGVRTLGEFAALPAPSVASRPSGLEVDYQTLARGESGTLLRPYAPEAAIREEIVVRAGNVLDGAVGSGAVSGPSAIALVARRLALRLAGRGRGAVKLDIAVAAGAEIRDLSLESGEPLVEAEQLARVLAPVMEAASTATWRLRVVVAGEAIVAEPGTLAAAGVVAARTFAAGSGSTQLGVVAAGTLQPRVELPPKREQAEPVGFSASTGPVDPLSIVLSTSGALFALSSPGRIDRPHRRTRRGKQRRMRPVTALGQSRLFDRG